eukprot:Nitzschia sp. Nitz4//scaffold102_size76354//36818//38526//NITZ4_005633-RA/size76354-snap-gene-0.126-mRNA-1//1//CDS//3329532252//8175//frame0
MATTASFLKFGTMLVPSKATSLQQQGTGTSKDSLLSLVLPWSAMFVVSVLAATMLSSSDRDRIDDSATAMFSRLLSTEPTQHAHAHSHVFEEAHKPLFPLDATDQIGFFAAILGLMVAAGGGIGGGGILVPIYILIMEFTPKHAIPLSNITVFGGALANMLLNAPKRHPQADRPLVDWDLILVMEPLTIAGALMGAFLNKILPELFLTVMLVLLLSFTAYNTLKKALKMYKAESKKLREQGLKPDGTPESELTKIQHKDDDQTTKQASDELLKNMELQEGESPGAGTDEATPEWKQNQKDKEDLQQILDEEKVVPTKNLTILIVMFVVVLSVNILKGGGAFPSPLGIQCGSAGFWMANLFLLVWILIISYMVRSYLVQRFEVKQRVGYKYLEGDIQWNARNTIVYPVICCLAGFFAGMFGVGGGIVKGPLMLAMGVHPKVASASSACMILFTSFTATTSFIVFGLLDEEYAFVCFAIGFVATYFGQIGLSILMKRAQRNSYIAFSIGGVVLLSALLMTVQSLLSMAEGEHHSSGGICGKDSD